MKKILIKTVMKTWLAIVASCSLALAKDNSNFAAAGAGNLAFVEQKILNGQPVRVGFLGGSITQGAGTPKHGDCYYWLTKLRLAAYAKEHGSTLDTVLAAVGGTGTEYGAYRVGTQLLDKDLDLLVVEFAVNDLSNPAALDGMEGIVRQALSRNPRMAIVLFYTTTLSALQDFYDKGTVPPSVAAFHRVAQHYHLPEIEAGPAVQASLRDGTNTPKMFFSDTVHPTKIGHAFYADFLSEALIQALESTSSSAPVDPTPIPAVLGSGQMERAHLEPIVPLEKTGEWIGEKPGYYTYLGSWKAKTPGASLSFSVKGERIFLLCGKVTKLRVSGENMEEKVISSAGRPGGIPTLQLIHAGPQPVACRVTVTLEPDNQGNAEAELAGLAIISIPEIKGNSD